MPNQKIVSLRLLIETTLQKVHNTYTCLSLNTSLHVLLQFGLKQLHSSQEVIVIDLELLSPVVQYVVVLFLGHSHDRCPLLIVTVHSLDLRDGEDAESVHRLEHVLYLFQAAGKDLELSEDVLFTEIELLVIGTFFELLLGPPEASLVLLVEMETVPYPL